MASAISRFRQMNSKGSIGNESACETGKLSEESLLVFALLAGFLQRAAKFALSKVINHATT
jgi:hypothetical protein